MLTLRGLVLVQKLLHWFCWEFHKKRFYAIHLKMHEQLFWTIYKINARFGRNSQFSIRFLRMLLLGRFKVYGVRSRTWLICLKNHINQKWSGLWILEKKRVQKGKNGGSIVFQKWIHNVYRCIYCVLVKPLILILY